MKLFGRRANLVFRQAAVGRDVSNLRVVFQVTKSNDSTANSAEVVVYNLSPESINFAKQKNAQLILAAGYDGGTDNAQTKVIFSGDIFRLATTKQGGDLVTKFENSDSLKILQSTQINKSFKGGASVDSLLNELVRATGLSKGEVQGFEGKQFSSGYSAFGGVRNQLDVLAQKTDTVWSIQDGVLQFIPATGFTSDSVIVLTPDTGLVGSPSQKVIRVGTVDQLGVEAVSLLKPEIKPGRRIEIFSRNVEGRYTVQKVTHRGDTRSGPWYSEIEATPS